MSTNWSDDIVVAQLDDEPALSDELATIQDKLDAMEGDRTPHVVLDFDKVSYVNSSNIAQLLNLRKTLEPAGRQMRLSAVRGEVWAVMQTTGLDRVLAFSPDTMTALAMLQLGADAAGADDEA
ncbi:MAG: STAS domain-containing protein [Planctomycetota bacterium]